jgi:hypothetical protein
MRFDGRRLGAIVALVVVFVLARSRGDAPREAPSTSPTPSRAIDGRSAIDEAFETQRSDLQVEASGVVTRVLADDNDGSRHQRFILRLASGRTVLVAHNIDLAPRLRSLDRGDTVRFFGEYEWNASGGVIHWTHRDPAGRHVGGWLLHEGTRVE